MRASIYIILTFFAFQAYGQLTSVFGDQGVMRLDFTNYDEVVDLESVDTDVLVCTRSFTFDGQVRFIPYISRLDDQGALITDFGTNGTATFEVLGYSSLEVIDMTVTDSMIYVTSKGYNDTTYDSKAILTRLKLSGEVDSSFGEQGHFLFTRDKATSYPARIYIDAASRPVIIGSIIDPMEEYDEFPLIVRLIENGSLDSSFGNSGYLQLFTNELLGPNRSARHAVGGSGKDILFDGMNYWCVGSISNGATFDPFVLRIDEQGHSDSLKYYISGNLPSNFSSFERMVFHEATNSMMITYWQREAPYAMSYSLFDLDDETFSFYSIPNDSTEDFVNDILIKASGETFLVGRSVRGEDFNASSYSSYVFVVKLDQNLTTDVIYRTDIGSEDAKGVVALTENSDEQLFIAGKFIEGSNQDGLVMKVDQESVLDVQANTVSSSISVFPTVARQSVLINSTSGILIMDARGNVINEIESNAAIQVQLDVSEYSRGRYFILNEKGMTSFFVID